MAINDDEAEPVPIHKPPLKEMVVSEEIKDEEVVEVEEIEQDEAHEEEEEVNNEEVKEVNEEVVKEEIKEDEEVEIIEKIEEDLKLEFRNTSLQMEFDHIKANISLEDPIWDTFFTDIQDMQLGRLFFEDLSKLGKYIEKKVFNYGNGDGNR